MMKCILNVLDHDRRSRNGSIVRVPFTGSVRLRAILLKAGPASHTPSKVLLVSCDRSYHFVGVSFISITWQFANEMNLDFDDAADRVPTQEVNIVETRQVGEYAIKCVQ
jgi:hypothetical protein